MVPPHCNQNTGISTASRTAFRNGRRGEGSKGGPQVTQINLHRSKIAHDTLSKTVSGEMESLILAQEPWTNPKGNACQNLRGYSLHTGETTGQRPRACIYTRGVTSWKMDSVSNGDLTAVRVDLPHRAQRHVVIASIYMAAEHSAPPPKLRELVEYCRTNKLPLIVGGDCNSHHTAWGSTDVNARGETLLEFLMGSDMDWCNLGTEPTFVTIARKEVLDITIRNDHAQDLVQAWKVEEWYSASDHRYIRFQLGTEIPEKEKIRPIRATDWNKFQDVIQAAADGIPTVGPRATVEAIEAGVDFAENTIQSAFEQSCRERYRLQKVRTTWWTEKLSGMRDKLRQSLKDVARSNNPDAAETHKSLQREYNANIRKARRQSWRKFAESIEAQNPMARAVKMLKRDRTAQLSAVRKEDNSLTESPEETLRTMLAHHTPDAQHPEEEEEFPQGEGFTDGEIKETLEETKMTKAIMSFEAFKSPGADGVYPVMLQKAWATPLKELYQGIFGACLHRGYIPKSWRRGRGVFIPKPGKNSYLEVKAFRMITLTSFQLKWLERLVYWRIESDKSVQDQMCNMQFGFRVGVSTDTALHALTTRIEKAMSQKQYALGIFLDIENAFPSVATEGIRRALVQLNVPTGIRTWIGTMLKHRTVTATLAGTEVTKKVTIGCPQGGILSPFLWNAVLNPFLKRMKERRIHVQAFADDIGGMFIGMDPHILISQAQDFLNEALSWGDSNELRFSQAKTEAIVFTKKRSWLSQLKLRMRGKEIDYSKEVKYLGVWLDNKLSFNKHVEDKATKAMAIMVQAKRLIGKTWGATPKMTRWVYTSMVRPIMSYGCLTWIKAIHNHTCVSRLRKVQRLACMMTTSAFPSSPTAALEMLIGLPPIEIFLAETAIMTSVRLQRGGRWETDIMDPITKVKWTHVDICNELRRTITTLNYPMDATIPRMSDIARYATTIQERDLATEQEKRTDLSTIRVFTDGSKLQNDAAGAGVVIFDGQAREEIHSHLGKTSTVFQAEVTALADAANTLLARRVEDRQIDMFSDSQAAILALKDHRTRARTVENCKAQLNKLSERNSIHIRWIPGHQGVAGNEEADAAAKAAAELKPLGPEPFLPIPEAMIRAEVRDVSRTWHKKQWTERPDCRQTKEAVGWAETHLTHKFMQMNRRDIGLVTQVITGHANLARHRHIQGKTTNPECPKCFEDEETPNHHVGQCLYYEKERVATLDKKTTTLREVVRTKNLKRLAKYLRETNRLAEFPEA